MAFGLFASLALIAMAPIAAEFFHRYPTPRACAHTLMFGMLFLPCIANFDFPLLPAFDKNSIPVLCCVAAIVVKGGFRRGLSAPLVILLFVLAFVISAGTWRTNRDSIVVGQVIQHVLPGLSFKDVISFSIESVVGTVLPFFIGVAAFATPKDRESLLRILVVWVVAYIPFILWELRMSPSLHYNFYGIQTRDFGQSIRWGGYRPQCFLEHGLLLSVIVLIAVLAMSAILPRYRRGFFGFKGRTIFWILVIVLVLCKSTGAIIIGLVAIPVMMRFRTKWIRVLGIVLVTIYMTYPVMRLTYTFPEQKILNAAFNLSYERGASLAYRFRNEELFLQKARARPWFGWGGYGRLNVYDSYGKPNVTDGYWVLIFTGKGYLGFARTCLMLVLPVILAARRAKRLPNTVDKRIISAMILMVGVWTLDLVPNGFPRPLLYVLTGSLYAFARNPQPRPAPAAAWRPPAAAPGAPPGYRASA
jgi:hypothetical protein